MPSPTISIIMAVYNTEFVLVQRAIESLFRQDFQDFELIIVDDGSGDELNVPLKKYLEQTHDLSHGLYSEKIKYLFHENLGFPKTLNRGIENGTGKYIGFLDSDDEYKPNHLSACLYQMKNYDLIASFTETVVDNNEDYHVPDRFDPHKNIHVDDCIITGTLFGKAEIFKTLMFKDIYSQDFDFFERVKEKYRVEKLNLKTYIYYRNRQDSICNQLKKKNAGGK